MDVFWIKLNALVRAVALELEPTPDAATVGGVGVAETAGEVGLLGQNRKALQAKADQGRQDQQPRRRDREGEADKQEQGAQVHRVAGETIDAAGRELERLPRGVDVGADGLENADTRECDPKAHDGEQDARKAQGRGRWEVKGCETLQGIGGKRQDRIEHRRPRDTVGAVWGTS